MLPLDTRSQPSTDLVDLQDVSVLQRPQSDDISDTSGVEKTPRPKRRRSIMEARLCKSTKVPVVVMSDLQFSKSIGEGAYGVVGGYTMLDENGRNIEVAVKKLKMQNTSPMAIEEFTREVRLQAQMDHPNIVKVLGLGTFVCPDFGDELPFLVQELMDTSLTAALKTKYTLKTGLGWCLNIAEALQYMHQSDPILIHRDLKPDNVLISKDGVAKVADLGLFAALHNENRQPIRRTSVHSNQSAENTSFKDAALQDDNDSSSYTSRISATLGGLHGLPRLSFLGDQKCSPEGPKYLTGKTGTWYYMAPENYRGEVYTEKADVFSFAMVMYAIINHREPYYDETRYLPDQIAAAAAEVGGMRPPLKKHWPQPIQELIKECWDLHPWRRPCFKDVVSRITSFIEDEAILTKDLKDPQGCRCIIA